MSLKEFDTDDGLPPFNLYPDCCGKNCAACKDKKAIEVAAEREAAARSESRIVSYKEPPKTPDQILAEMAKTFEERGKIYGDNWKRIGEVLWALAGKEPVVIDSPEKWMRWSLHMLVVTKITRLATTNLNHIDSSHDAAVYLAMLEAVQQEQQNG